MSSIWPLGDYQVSGKRLSRMYENLMGQDKKKTEQKEDAQKSVDSSRPRKAERKADLEDGEIASDREERRVRDAYRDDRRDYRRDERHEPKRPNYYDNDDRLNFYRYRREGDRGASRASWQGRSAPARNGSY